MNARIQYWRWLAVISLLGAIAPQSPVRAQNITPSTHNGTGTVINNKGNQQFDITGGTTSAGGANLFHSFQQFSLDAGQTANFISAPNIHNILGRVTGGDASIINGLIQVTGGNSNLYLMNPAGILFGPSARLDVPASFSVTTATGIGFGNNWFNAVGSNDYHNLVGTPNRYRFDVGKPGAIVNTGNLELSPGQDLTLTGGGVINTGDISTPGGNVTIAAVEGSDTIRISQPGHLLNLEISRRTGVSPVSQEVSPVSQEVSPVSGQQITPLSLPGLLTQGNFNSHATGMTVNENGIVVLTGPVEQASRLLPNSPGAAITSGNIDTGARNPVSEGIGGEVNVLGSRVGILNANINADGVNGGGNVFIGGDFQGNNRLPASQQTVINNSTISANALQNGDGGRVIIWSDGTTRFEGNITATGGEYSGDGGFVEVSGLERLVVDGNIDVGADNGDTGSILFDPRNILIDDIEENIDEENTDIFAEDENGDVTISATQLEELEGEITLKADSDITVNQEINTSESVEFNAGRSININADIDTSSGNGNISLFGNDNGANATNRTAGAANINQRENTTINAGAGNITIQLGSLGEVGDINVENLTTTGRVLVDANGGNIGRISEQSLITAGNGIFRTTEEGSIGLAAEPLRLQVDNLEATAGSGGAFFESLQGLNVRGITTRGGGSIQLSVEGDLTVTGDISSSFKEGNAGNVEIVSSGGIDSTGSTIESKSDSGNGGDISLRATGDIDTGDVKSDVASTRTGGNITLESTGGAIATTTGTLDAGSIGGNGGSIVLDAAGDITTGTVRAAFRSSARGKDENVEVVQNVSVRDPDEIFADGTASTETEVDGNGGAIAFTAGGQIDTTAGTVNSSSSTGSGANVTMNATGIIRTGGINSSGSNGPGGNITLSSSDGGIDTREGPLDSRSETDNGGNISLEAARNVRTERLLSSSIEENATNSRDGGDVTITAGGQIDTTEGFITSSSKSGSGGNAVLRASGDVRTDDVIAQGGVGSGGNITIESSSGAIDTSLGELSATALGGDGGNISLEAARGLITGKIQARSQTATPNQTSRGTGGNITLQAGGELTSFGALDSSSEFGSAGNISAIATGDANILNEITSSSLSNNGNGGNITIESRVGAIAISGFVNSSADSGNGGKIDLSAAGDISVTDIFSGVTASDSEEDRREDGSGGSITITAGGSFDAVGGEIESDAALGEGGNIALSATGNIIVSGVSAKGGSRGGDISITSTQGGINTTQGAIDSSAGTGRGGNIAIDAKNIVVTDGLSSTGNRRGGNISITSEVGDVDTSSGELNSSSDGARGDITIDAPLGSIAIGTIAQGDAVTNAGNSVTDLETELTDATTADVNEENGTVRLEAHNDITIDEAIASDSISNLEMRAGRNININANINTSGANGDITLQANDPGADADLRNRGRGNVRMAEGTTLNSGGGDITISLGTFGTDNNIGNITLSNIRTRGTFSANARGGNILSAGRTGVSPVIKAGTALFQTLGEGSIGLSGEPLRLDVNILEAKAGSGGAFFYSPNGGLTVGSDEEALLGIVTTGGGDIEIEVEGDLTVAEPISTAVDVGPGGNISLTAAGAIDTSQSVLTATSGRGRGGDITLTGDGDVTAGNINSYARERGNGGNIIINSGGAIDTSAGSLISRANEGDGGDIALRGDGDLTTRKIESYSNVRGNGGQITLESTRGAIDTAEGEISSSAALGDGGKISITAPEGDVTTGVISSDADERGRGGSIEIASGGNVDSTEGDISSNSSAGNGGEISISAEGNIDTGTVESNSGVPGQTTNAGNSDAGNIELNAGGSINTTEGSLSSSSASGAGGNITLTSNENITTGNIDTFSEGGGSGGNIFIESRRGAVDTTEGELSSFSSAGDGGNIELGGRLDILTGDINTLSLGRGGSISIESRQGAIDTTSGQLNSNSTNGRGGDVTLNAQRDILTGDINSFAEGRGRGGNITIESQNGVINTTEGQLSSNSFLGDGGNIAIAGSQDIATANITSIAETDGRAGDISIETTGGAIDATVGRLSSSSVEGDGGNISLTATGDINTDTIDSFSEGNGNGGNITIDSKANVDTTAGLLSSRASGDGGDVTLRAEGNISTALVESFSSRRGKGGNIEMDAGGDIDATGGELMSRSEAGDGGNVTLTAEGSISSALVESFSSGTGKGGNIEMDAGGDIDTSGGELISRSRLGAAGNVSLSSGGNLTTSAIESLSLDGPGGDIALTATGDIDTSAGELISRSDTGDGGSVTLSSGGNISTAVIESLSGNGRGGDINLTATGDIDTSMGELISRSRDGDGGNVSLSSGGIISIGGIESLSKEGTGGDINLTATGDIDTSAGELTSLSTGGSGGSVTVSSGGIIRLGGIESLSQEGSGGDINIVAEGDIDTTRGQLTSRSREGDGGNVSLNSGGNISTAVIESLSNGGEGGNINIVAGDDIDTTKGELTSRSSDGDGGSVSLRGGGNIITNAIESFSRDGRGGEINLNAVGNIDTSRSEILSLSQTGEGGNVTVTAEGNINTGFIESFSGEGVRGGGIDIISRNGTINTTVGDLSGEPQIAPNADVSTEEVARTFETEQANLSSFAPEGIGGSVTLEAKGDITTSHISSFGGEDSGDVRITTEGNINTGVLFSTAIEGIGGEIDIISTNNGNIDIEHIAAYSQNGSGGEIEIGANGNIILNNAASFGPLQSGDVIITSDNGTITTGTLQTRAPNGTSGNISLNTFSVEGDIRTANVSTVGGRAAGAVQILAADGSVTAEDLLSSSTGGTAGGIDVQAGGGDVTTGDQTVNAQTGDANINVGASGDISAGNQTATTDDGNASINNVAGGNINLRDQLASATGGNANINNQAGGNINVAGDQTAVADGGNASINNVAGGNITVGGDQTAVADGGNANINNVAGGNITVGGDQTAVADGGNASINNVAGGNITVGGDQTAIAFGGDANINNVAGGNITTGDQTALSEGGNAFINNNAGGNLTTGDQIAVAPDGINQVTNNAGGAIDTGQLVQGGNDITPFLNNNPVLVVGNNNTQPVVVPTQVPSVVTPATQPVAVPTQVPSVVTPATQPVAVPTPVPSVVTPPTQPVVVPTQVPPVVTPPTQAPSVVTPPTQAPSVVTPPTQPVVVPPTQATQPLLAIVQPPTPSEAVTSNSPAFATRAGSDVISNSQLPISSAMTVAANSQTMARLEENRTQEFADYFGLDFSEELNSTKNVREILSDIAEQTGNRSAVVYVSAHAEKLQLVLYTPEGEAILKTIPGATREIVLKIVRDLNYKITSRRFRGGTAYLKPAQQLYQWLIAPIAAELEAANIDTLLFSLPSGLRALPVAALHDGEQFFIEKYSFSMIPSISLMDSRYRSLSDTAVLAMGASEFNELSALPAVPVEVETIARELWEGRAFLNEEFTLENLISQRQDYPYPIIHLATHGQFKAGEASNSYIQFWGEERLTLDRVRELGLNNPPVELLVLSACRTAVGDTNAELGFAGLAVAAGVKSALASLWYVSDEGTLGLMAEFYTHLEHSAIKAEALREAQLAMLRGEVRIEGGELRGIGERGGTLLLPPALGNIVNSDLSHPYYWAAFTTIGSPW
ncbi:MAG: CHAT domain-containing protein [Cyanobacteriota bacterium]|nr:CHAT domain-containing protein [Cyanobacteriota bacterium]